MKRVVLVVSLFFSGAVYANENGLTQRDYLILQTWFYLQQAGMYQESAEVAHIFTCVLNESCDPAVRAVQRDMIVNRLSTIAQRAINASRSSAPA